jgi:hypothetical protein
MLNVYRIPTGVLTLTRAKQESISQSRLFTLNADIICSLQNTNHACKPGHKTFAARYPTLQLIRWL